MKITEGLAIAIVSAVIGSATTVITSSLSYFNTSRELDIKMVEVALTILSAEKKGTDTEQARRYALRSLEKYGGVAIPDDEFEQWVDTGTVPVGPLIWRDAYQAFKAEIVPLANCATGYAWRKGDTYECTDYFEKQKRALPSLPNVQQPSE